MDYETYDEGPEDFEDHCESRNCAGKETVKPSERLKVEMQVLHMSDESQTMVQSMLKELHGDHYRVRDARTYRDSGNSLGRFWLRDSRLMVRGVIDHTVQMNGKSVSLTEQEQAEEAVNQYALGQLQKYGFHKTRCSQALRNCHGDYGLALQTLMSDCFNLGLQGPFEEDKCDSNETFGDDELEDVSEEGDDSDIDEWKDYHKNSFDLETNADDKENIEATEVMEDERMALAAIYPEKFVERIPERLWEIKLNLPYLNKYLPLPERQFSTPSNKPINIEHKGRDKAGPREENRLICRFFLNGHCKFGKRCRFKHEKPVGESVLKKNSNETENIYLLEIRFPNSTTGAPSYPRSAPLVCFS